MLIKSYYFLLLWRFFSSSEIWANRQMLLLLLLLFFLSHFWELQIKHIIIKAVAVSQNEIQYIFQENGLYQGPHYLKEGELQHNDTYSMCSLMRKRTISHKKRLQGDHLSLECFWREPFREEALNHSLMSKHMFCIFQSLCYGHVSSFVLRREKYSGSWPWCTLKGKMQNEQCKTWRANSFTALYYIVFICPKHYAL